MRHPVTIIISGLLMLVSSSCVVATTTRRVYNRHRPSEAFVLFYSASCPHCQRFDPILKRYAVSHHMADVYRVFRTVCYRVRRK